MLQFDLEIFFTVTRCQLGDFLVKKQADQWVMWIGEFFNG